MNQSKTKQLMNRRGQMFAIGLIVWILLACWTVSAFWTHINSLNEDYQFAARLGALAAEVIGLGFLYWHCYDPSITIRKWALIFSVILASILVFHSGALRGLRDARIQQTETEQRLKDTLTEMSKEQAGSITAGNAQTQRERIALERQAKQAQTEVNKAAQEQVAKEIITGNDKVKDTAIVPRWYLDGWMYGAIFMSAMVMLGILWWKMSDADDVDLNFNNIPDKDEQPEQQPVQATPVSVQAQPMSTAQKQNELPKGVARQYPAGAWDGHKSSH